MSRMQSHPERDAARLGPLGLPVGLRAGAVHTRVTEVSSEAAVSQVTPCRAPPCVATAVALGGRQWGAGEKGRGPGHSQRGLLQPEPFCPMPAHTRCSSNTTK